MSYFVISIDIIIPGSDFIKTSTGKEGVNATFPVGLVMVRAIRDYYEKTKYKVSNYFHKECDELLIAFKITWVFSYMVSCEDVGKYLREIVR